MIEVKDKSKCCGCESCVNACPVGCITFKVDNQGFGYPQADSLRCINCGLCEKVCPCLNIKSKAKPQKIYASINPDEEIRRKSSSGGIFTMLAEEIISRGGYVFGAAYNDEWNVNHICVTDKNDISKLRGAKYVQSGITDTYRKSRNFLESGKPVLFSGTPCQIAGLKQYLLKDYRLLFTVDIVCHSVPSPLVWQCYLKSLNPYEEKIEEINLRDKSNGWARYNYFIRSSKRVLYGGAAADSNYLKGFNKNLFSRPSCFKCPAKEGRSKSDITLADNWGYETTTPEITDNMGISAVIINSKKGAELFEGLNVWKKEIQLDIFEKANPSYLHSAKHHKGNSLFWKLFPEYGLEAVPIVFERTKPNLANRVWLKLHNLWRK